MLAFSVKHDARLILTEAAKSVAHHSDFTFVPLTGTTQILPQKNEMAR